MGTVKKTIAMLAFSAILALSLAANTTQAFAATTTDTHGAQVANGGRGHGHAPLPVGALGITWE